ncbi:hypothetical protein M441DRAFT_272064 [Trichoderma asperellum CBS 433.97]|uniref:Uncharacterized protein n=1 Tax=Trichoderma asperellum (strain ATCC 204424 / CBS 433.97 / NBRC 101777) TaxID=1042311 RepID=A0A2T3YWJ2_TRIA4|nr:hypothetical protein M441DRAFT_272064 [Trichoderma asperellum CBS 433.97]PTB36922.1 hypothetical protein M441DRAFT_272064 [Trichoderma asperellum CBS 433.97]
MQEASETRYGQLPTRYEESECGPTRQSFTENNRATRSTVDVYHINASWLPRCNRGLACQLPRADTPLNIGSIDVHCAISYLLTHKPPCLAKVVYGYSSEETAWEVPPIWSHVLRSPCKYVAVLDECEIYGAILVLLLHEFLVQIGKLDDRWLVCGSAAL